MSDEQSHAGKGVSPVSPLPLPEDAASQPDEPPQERRCSRRLQLAIQLEVTGFDRTGQFFSGYAMTANISERGCRFDLLYELLPGDAILVRLARPSGRFCGESRPIPFEIVWIEPNEHGWTVGAAKLRSEHFPSPRLTPEQMRETPRSLVEKR